MLLVGLRSSNKHKEYTFHWLMLSLQCGKVWQSQDPKPIQRRPLHYAYYYWYFEGYASLSHQLWPCSSEDEKGTCCVHAQICSVLVQFLLTLDANRTHDHDRDADMVHWTTLKYCKQCFCLFKQARLCGQVFSNPGPGPWCWSTV